MAVTSIFSFFRFDFKKEIEKHSIAFYNVENLFDAKSNNSSGDHDFSPKGSKKWNPTKYQIKLDNLSKVIAHLGDGLPPFVAGLCEIENEQVLNDLINTTILQPFNYSIIHKNSPDERGIDVAAIYRKDFFSEITCEFLHVNLPIKADKTRDILYLKGKLNSNFPIHILFNHWPSRRDGKSETESKRLAAANVVKEKIDRIVDEDPSANIIILGDFNDEPSDKSIIDIINAGKITDQSKKMVNLMFPSYTNKEGTLFYEDEWMMFDQIMVTRNLTNSSGQIHVHNNQGHIFKPDWVMYEHKNGNITPNKSYSGTHFHKNGYSDHLAVYASLVVRK